MFVLGPMTNSCRKLTAHSHVDTTQIATVTPSAAIVSDAREKSALNRKFTVCELWLCFTPIGAFPRGMKLPTNHTTAFANTRTHIAI